MVQTVLLSFKKFEPNLFGAPFGRLYCPLPLYKRKAQSLLECRTVLLHTDLTGSFTSTSAHFLYLAAGCSHSVARSPTGQRELKRILLSSSTASIGV